MNRRETLKFLAGAAAFAGTAGVLGRGVALAQAKPFTLPPLGYANDALEPHIDARTMQIHHDNHHAAYVNNLNGVNPTIQDDIVARIPFHTLKRIDCAP